MRKRSMNPTATEYVLKNKEKMDKSMQIAIIYT
jgi:hypothetical protein